MSFSPKQKQVLKTAVDETFKARLVAIPGPVRSGKTYSAVASFLTFTLKFENQNFLMAAPGQKQINGALLSTARQLGFPISPGVGQYRLPRGNTLYTYPIQRPESAKRVGGITIQGGLVDETVDCNEESVKIVIERASLPGARVWLLTNPKQPTHWFKKDILDKITEGKLSGIHVPFNLDDNPTLEQDYKDQLREMLSGMQLLRRYYGQWTASTLSIYPYIERAITSEVFRPSDINRFDISIDHASSGTTHATLWGWPKAVTKVGKIRPVDVQAIDEFSHDPENENEVLEWRELVEAILKKFLPWLKGKGVGYWVVDTSPAGLATTIRRMVNEPRFKGHGGTVLNAHKVSITEGIDIVKLFQLENFFSISQYGAPTLIKQLINYLWDERAAKRGEDKPVKLNDHGPDNLRYYFVTLAYGQVVNKWYRAMQT